MLFFFLPIILFTSCKKDAQILETPKKKNAISQIKPVDSIKLNIAYNGIGGYNLDNKFDKIIAYDYAGTGKDDYLITYRPGSKILWIQQNNGGTFTPILKYMYGFNGYDLSSPSDLIIPFDYDHSGLLDDLVFYRPDMRVVWIFRNNHNGTFTKVFSSTTGIGGFPFGNIGDRMVAYDYTGSGNKDHLLCYRPGSNMVHILKNTNGVFTPVFTSTTGIGGFQLTTATITEIMPYDWDNNGSEDYLLCYSSTETYSPQPGGGSLQITRVKLNVVANYGGTFTSVHQTGWDLQHPNNILMPIYYLPYKNVLIEYGPGTKWFKTRWYNWSSQFVYDYQSTNGVAGYNLDSDKDRIITFDYNHSGNKDHFIIYRPGDQIITIMKYENSVFSQVL